MSVPRELLERVIEANVPQPALRQATFQALLDVLQGGAGFAALQGALTAGLSSACWRRRVLPAASPPCDIAV